MSYMPMAVSSRILSEPVDIVEGECAVRGQCGMWSRQAGGAQTKVAGIDFRKFGRVMQGSKAFYSISCKVHGCEYKSRNVFWGLSPGLLLRSHVPGCRRPAYEVSHAHALGS